MLVNVLLLRNRFTDLLMVWGDEKMESSVSL